MAFALSHYLTTMTQFHSHEQRLMQLQTNIMICIYLCRHLKAALPKLRNTRKYLRIKKIPYKNHRNKTTKIETVFPARCALRSPFHVFLFQDSCTYTQSFALNMFAHLPFRTLSFSSALKTAPLSLLMQNKCIF